jgi:GT2 family glycosyltransferase
MKPGVQVVSQLPFFCTVIKRRVLDDAVMKEHPLKPILDGDFIHYGADSDLCERVKRAGYKLIWVKDVWVENQESELKPEWKAHDGALFRKKWGWGG